MREKRSFFRFEKLRKIRYLLSGEVRKWQECAIIDVSHMGMKIRFHEGIDVDSTISFVLNVPGESLPINLKGTLKRIEGRGRDFIGGVELSEKLDHETFITIMNGYRAAQTKTVTTPTKEVREDACTHTQQTISALFSKAPLSNSSCKQVFSFISTSVSLFSLVLFLSLPVFFLLVTGYFTGNTIKEETEKHDRVVPLTEVPSSTNPDSRAAAEHITAVLKNSPGIRNEATAPRVDYAYTISLKRAGGSLYSLALKHYQRADETVFDLILQANPALTDIRHMHDEQKITLPALTSASYVRKITAGSYQVHVGTFQNMDLVGICSDKVIYLGKSIIIQPHRFSAQDIWYRVLLGDFTSKGEALKAVAALNKKGIIYIPPKVIAES